MVISAIVLMASFSSMAPSAEDDDQILGASVNTEWAKTFGGSSDDLLLSVIAIDDGFVAVGCSYSNNGDLNGLNKGNLDSIIVKFDEDGDIIWAKTFGGSGMDEFCSVIAVDDGFIAVGYSNSNNGDLNGLNKGGYDAIIVKFDEDGDVIWVKTFGGSSDDHFYSVISVDDGFVAAGYSNSNNGDLNGLNKGNVDAIIVKFDDDGDVIWAKTFGGSKEDIFGSIIAIDGGLVAVGISESNDKDLNGLSKGNVDAIIVKFTDDGNGNGDTGGNGGGTGSSSGGNSGGTGSSSGGKGSGTGSSGSKSGGNGDDNNLILIAAVVAVALVAGILVYVLVMRPKA